MRWSIRYQLLVPLLVLLLSIAGTSAWTAAASADRAWQQIETRLRNVARTFSESSFPLSRNVLDQAKGLSGADYLLAGSAGRPITTLGDQQVELPPAECIVADWQALHLGTRSTVAGQAYFCCGIRLAPPRAATLATLYILYPESLWREALWEAVRPSLVLGGFAGVVSVVLAFGVTRGLSRRILEVERRTREIAAGDFRSMPLSGHNDELRDLASSINEMATRLAQLQEAAQKNERLRLLGQVSSGLAHQLRNSVTGALLAVQLHARECNHGADREALDVALRQLALLESNLKRFLDLGRSDERRVESCSVIALLDEAVSLLRPQCRHSHIALRWEPPETRPRVAGDPGQLGHLFLNVLGNAVEAAGPGGWVELRVQVHASDSPDASAKLSGPQGRCLIEVADSGPGPSPNVADRLFEPFVTGKQEGVGLGLAVARQVAETHGGSIRWQRTPRGTSFQIELPLEEANAEKQPPCGPPAEDTANRISLVPTGTANETNPDH